VVSKSSSLPAGERGIHQEDEMRFRLFGTDLKSNEPRAPLDIEADTEEAARTQAVVMGMEVLQIERFQHSAIEGGAGPANIARHPAKPANRIKVIAFGLMVSGLLLTALNPVIEVVYHRVGVMSGTLGDEPAWVVWWVGLQIIALLCLIFACTVMTYYGVKESKGPRLHAFTVKWLIILWLYLLFYAGVIITIHLWFPDRRFVLDYLNAIGTLIVVVITVKRTRIEKEEAAGASKG
jgi:hypothetical protein